MFSRTFTDAHGDGKDQWMLQQSFVEERTQRNHLKIQGNPEDQAAESVLETKLQPINMPRQRSSTRITPRNKKNCSMKLPDKIQGSNLSYKNQKELLQ